MGTVIRSDISRKNPYWIEKYRFLELKNFCLQYPIWEKAYNSLCGLSSRPIDLVKFSNDIPDPTARCAEAMAKYSRWMGMIEDAASKTDPVIGIYILKGVTEGKSYEVMKAKENIPCCKDKYYELYRKFFWVLNELRD